MGSFFLTAFVMLLLGASVCFAQDETKNLTAFREFKPAVVHMANGTTVKTKFANIFLKNAALLFLRGENTMEANMEPIVSVDINDQRYVKIDDMLALEIDSVGENVLYCATTIDLVSYKTMLRNNVNISNISFGDNVSYSTVDLTPEEGMPLPLIPHFYYYYNGEMVKVHEREISRRLSKEKKRAYKTIISLPDFSWVDAESLVTLLKAISE
jgi:hypothetical protein